MNEPPSAEDVARRVMEKVWGKSWAQVAPGTPAREAATAMRDAMLDWIVARWPCQDFPSASCQNAFKEEYWCPVCVARKLRGK